MGTGSREGQVAPDPVRMRETCRICARELCGNQRRWIFHPSARVNLRAVLSHALGRELGRGGGEFACSKCAFMLERMYRFDTVIARVEALSLGRVHKLLLEKERLRRCIGGLYRRNNGGREGAGPGEDPAPGQEQEQDREQRPQLAELPDARYLDMVQDDLAYSVYESWADHREGEGEEEGAEPHPLAPPPRRCRGCAALRVADSDYEAVCKVPRGAGRRSTSCGPPTRCSTTTLGGQDPEPSSAILGGQDLTHPKTTTATLGDQDPETSSAVSGAQDPTPSEYTTATLGGHGHETTETTTAIPGAQDPETTKTTTATLGGHGHETTETTTATLGPHDLAAPLTTTTLESPEKTLCGGPSPSPASSLESLDTALDLVGGPPLEKEGVGLEAGLRLLRSCRYRPLQPPRSSRLPLLLPLPLPTDRLQQALPRWPSRAAPELLTTPPQQEQQQQELQAELQEMEEQWLDEYVQWEPMSCQQVDGQIDRRMGRSRDDL